MQTRTKAPLRRRLQFEGIVGGIAEASIKSMTRDDGTKHHPRVRLESGAVHCSCEHFTFRLAKHDPTLANPDLWCKHLKRQVSALMRRGEIADKWLLTWLRPCIGCGVVDAENPIVGADGPITGYVCNACDAAWQREENASDPAPLCCGCSYPENICEARNICGDWDFEHYEMRCGSEL